MRGHRDIRGCQKSRCVSLWDEASENGVDLGRAPEDLAHLGHPQSVANDEEAHAVSIEPGRVLSHELADRPCEHLSSVPAPEGTQKDGNDRIVRDPEPPS